MVRGIKNPSRRGVLRVVPPGLEPHIYTLDNQLVIKTNGTHWVPTESVKADTLYRPSPGYSPVWT